MGCAGHSNGVMTRRKLPHPKPVPKTRTPKYGESLGRCNRHNTTSKERHWLRCVLSGHLWHLDVFFFLCVRFFWHFGFEILSGWLVLLSFFAFFGWFLSAFCVEISGSCSECTFFDIALLQMCSYFRQILDCMFGNSTLQAQHFFR
jgi:hypothetical protein